MPEWFENLPDQCPPNNAKLPMEEPYYRLISNENEAMIDMVSQRFEFPLKVFPLDECTCMSVSIFNDKNSCEAMLKFPRHQNKIVYQLNLKETDGLLMQSFKPNHYSWWRSTTFVLANE